MLLRLAYLTVTNVLAALRLLPLSDREMDVEILALRHQLAVLGGQFGEGRVRFAPADWAFLLRFLLRCRAESCAACGCWSDRTPCCAGIAT
ncbi:hypothetical protein ABH930_004913 [Kitasatospora sp. GAS204A]|nr:hypothetical protein [Kitasatospora sp. GAS204B]